MVAITTRSIANAGNTLLPSIDAARGVAMLLVNGQLRSGGWPASIECDAGRRYAHDYRLDRVRAGSEKRSTLDNCDAHEVLRFLMKYDVSASLKDAIVHEAVQYAIDALLAVQRPNGGWPQMFAGPCVQSEWPDVLVAVEPPTSHEWPVGNVFSHYYTFNDSVVAEMLPLLREACLLYSDDRCRKAAESTRMFILSTQGKTLQAAWCQQYDASLRPAWARPWEPPCLATYESQWVCIRLLEDRRDDVSIEAARRCVDWLERVTLSDGRLPRFIEIATDRPVYITPGFKWTYDDTVLMPGYSFKVASEAKRIRSLVNQ